MNLITLQTTKEGTVARSLLSYGTMDGALSALYQSMRASIADANIVKVVCLLIDDNGIFVKREAWERAEESEEE